MKELRTTVPRNPNWTRDELILALDLYMRHRGGLPNQKEIEVLSDLLRRLWGPGGQFNANFRNTNSVGMKLGNFQRIDPEHTSSGRKGLPNGGKGEEAIWKEFSVDLQHLAATAAAIKATLNDWAVRLEPSDDPDDGAEANEGRVLTKLHQYRERNSTLKKKKKEQALRDHGALICEGCGFDFEQTYGERGSGFIETHHLLPLHELPAERKTKLSDLALVCANCHRMIHAKRPWLTMEQLHSILH